MLLVFKHTKKELDIAYIKRNLGTKIFWKGIRAYYLKYKDLNTSTKDFKTIMEEFQEKI